MSDLKKDLKARIEFKTGWAYIEVRFTKESLLIDLKLHFCILMCRIGLMKLYLINILQNWIETKSMHQNMSK